ncbi:MAG: protease SohB, partial [Gammaproteobacteria bacterium]
MDFTFGIAEFLLQAVILLGVFLGAVAGILALTQRKRGAGEEGSVEARSLNERLELHEDAVRAITDDPIELKSRGKEQKKQKKAERKAAKAAVKAGNAPKSEKPRVFVLDFDGDMQASQV